MDNQNKDQLRFVFEIIEHWKFLIIFFCLFGVSIGLIVYLVQPKVYESTALLSYQHQDIATAQQKMRQGGRGDIRDIISTLTQIVMSRTVLEKIIIDENLYVEKRAIYPIEDVIEGMRENIAIIPSKKGDTFVITFSGSNATQVARVTNALAARFIEENLKYREEKASEASAYTQDELNMAKRMLDKKEAVMRDFKLKHYNEMPEQRATNFATLTALQSQYQQKQDSIQDLEKTRVLIRDQMVARQQLIDLENARRDSQARGNNKNIGPRSQLQAAEEELERLSGKYKDKHPKIRSIKATIASLEQEVAQSKENGAGQTITSSNNFDAGMFELELNLKSIKLSIQRLESEKKELLNTIKKTEDSIEAAPVVEAQWASLTREYDQFKQRYDFLVGQNLQARSILNLERKQKGSQFKIEDPARRPIKPTKPDFFKVMAASLFLGLAVGSGIAVSFKIIDPSFSSPDSLEKFAGINVICSIPKMEMRHEMKKKRLWLIANSFISVVWLIALILAVGYLFKNGKIIF